jgi:hypothetical protein
MTKQNPTWQVIPTSAQESDRQSAMTGEKILEYLWHHLIMRNKLMDVLRWSRVCGGGFWKIYWDSAKGQKVQIVADPEGNPVMHGETGAPMKPSDFEGELPEGLQSKTIATGDVHIEVISPFEFYPDPIATELEECEWCIQVTVKSPEYVKAHFDQEVEPDTDVGPGPTESRLFPSFQMGGTSGFRGVKLHEYWCKPNSQHPEGRRAVWAKGKMLFEGPNPYKRLPYAMFKGIPVPGRFWPSSTTEQLRGPQTELNKIRSQITENAQRIGNPAIVKSRQANVQYSGVPGEEVLYDDTVPNSVPTYLQPPQMPNYVLQQQERSEQSMQEISGQHEVSNAQVPAGVKAASAINLLQEADDTRLGPAIYDMEETLGRAGTMLLELVARYWTDERIVMIAAEDHPLEALNFRGAALKENTHAEVQSGSMFPKSKAAKQAAIQDMMNLYLQYQGDQPMNKRMVAKVMRDMEAGALGKLFGDLAVDEGQINEENQELGQGAELAINVFDDHEAHIEGHTEFQKGPVYKTLGPVAAIATERHVALHRQQLMAAQGPHQAVVPAESLAYKDAPPDIRRQIEAQAGLEPSHEPELSPAEQQAKPEPAANGKKSEAKQPEKPKEGQK